MSRVYQPIEGMKIAINDITGTFRSCRCCGHTLAEVSTKPVGLHAGELKCCGCGERTSFLGRDHMAALLAQRGAA